MERVSLLGLLGLAALSSACTELGPIGAGVCGNGVIESGEDCDQGGGQCIPAGQPFECRLTCESDPECPTGWRCGADAVCREPTGSFEVGELLVADGQMGIRSGEVNGAKPADLVSITVSGELSVRYGGSDFADTSRFASSPFIPVLGGLSEGDFEDDIVHIPSGGVGVLLGSSQKTLRPVTYSPIPANEESAHFSFVEAKYPNPSSPNPFEAGLYGQDDILEFAGNEIRDALSQTPPGKIATLPFDAKTLVPKLGNGELPTGNLDESPASPCRELLLLSQGADKAYVYSPCKALGFAWNDDFNALPPVVLPGKIGPGGALADLDGDGHLDMIVVGPQKPGKTDAHESYVAFGAGDGTFNSTSPAVKGAVDNKASATALDAPGAPLAAGDFSGDGRADLVFPSAFIVSKPGCKNIDASCYQVESRPGGGFTHARVADFNGDGLNDVIAIDGQLRAAYFFNGTGSMVLNPFEVKTVGYPVSLVVGDFDGDLIQDAAVTERDGSAFGVSAGPSRGGPTEQEPATAFSVMFGSPSGAPQPAVRMGELAEIEGVGVGNLSALNIATAWDKFSDVGIVGRDQAGSRTVALFGGASSRQMQSPFNLTKGAVPDLPVAVQVGQLTDDAHLDIAALALSAIGTNFWLIPSTGTASLSVTTTTVTPVTADIDACTALLVRADVDEDGRDEVLIIGRSSDPTKTGTRIVVARSQGKEWKLDPPVELAGVSVGTHPLPRSLCYANVPGYAAPTLEVVFGRAEVGSLSGSGPPDLVLSSFAADVGPGRGQLTSKLLVMVGSKLDQRVDIELPPDVHPVSFTLLNADQDPALEIVYFAPEGTFLAELDLAQAKLIDVTPISVALDPAGADYEGNPPIDLVSGDFNGDGMPDVAMARMFSTQLYYGVPVKR